MVGSGYVCMSVNVGKCSMDACIRMDGNVCVWFCMWSKGKSDGWSEGNSVEQGERVGNSKSGKRTRGMRKRR